jgi:hypothetical protein
MRHVCVDACFLIGVYDNRDQHHTAALNHFSQLFDGGNNRMLVPWPIVYEAVSTRLVRDKNGINRLERDWGHLHRSGRLELLSDVPYREKVVQDCFDELGRPPGAYRTLSAVDRVLRNILMDPAVLIHAFVTFNAADFADVCRKRNRELIA